MEKEQLTEWANTYLKNLTEMMLRILSFNNLYVKKMDCMDKDIEKPVNQITSKFIQPTAVIKTHCEKLNYF